MSQLTFHFGAKSGIAVLNRKANMPGDSDPRSQVPSAQDKKPPKPQGRSAHIEFTAPCAQLSRLDPQLSYRVVSAE